MAKNRDLAVNSRVKSTSVENSPPTPEWEEWKRAQNTTKTQWVVAVLAFWITTAISVVVYFVDHKLNLVLLCIALGTLILGVWLKARFLLHTRREPPRIAGQ